MVKFRKCARSCSTQLHVYVVILKPSTAKYFSRHSALISVIEVFLKNSSVVKSVFCLSLASHADTANPSQIIPDAASLPAAVTAMHQTDTLATRIMAQSVHFIIRIA